MLQTEGTYLNQYRALKSRYPNRDARGMLLDLIGRDVDPARWFAAASRSGYLDIALDCAERGAADPKTLIRAGQACRANEPAFVIIVARRALELMLEGHGYEVTRLEIAHACNLLTESARKLKRSPEVISWLHGMTTASQDYRRDLVDALKEKLLRME